MATTRRKRLEAARRRREQAYLAQRQRYEAWSAQEERLRGLVPKVLDVLERALDDPEQGPKLALAVLRAAGLWGLRPITRPDPVLCELSAGLEDMLSLSAPSPGDRLDGEPAGAAAPRGMSSHRPSTG